MAVAALSTSAIALTANPGPQPGAASGPEAAQAFSRLVVAAKPDDASAQGRAGAGPGKDGEAEGDAVTAEGGTGADSTFGDATEGKPLDILSDLEAMAAAASQIIVAAPTPLPAPATTAAPVCMPGTEKGAPAPAAIDRSAPKAVAPAATGHPSVFTKAFMTSRTAPLPKAIGPVPAGPGNPSSAPVAQGGAAPAVDAAAADVRPIADIDADAAPDVKPARGNIANLLASLRSAFTPGKAHVEAAAPQPGIAGMEPLQATTAAPTASDMTASAAAQAVAAQPVAMAADLPTLSNPAAPVPMGEMPSPVAARGRKAKETESLAPAGFAAAGIATSTAHTPIARPADAADMISAPDDGASQAATAAGSIPAASAAPDSQIAQIATPIVDASIAGFQPGQPATPATTPVEGSAPAASHTEMAVDRHLDLARDTQWLDRLARDISQAAHREGHLRFQLNPENLGALTVEIANGAAGTAIKLTAETDHARSIIADAQPQLIAEVRAQGLRVSETHVELNQQQQQQAGGGSASAHGGQHAHQQQHRPSGDHQPFERTQARSRDEAGDSAPQDDGELYA